MKKGKSKADKVQDKKDKTKGIMSATPEKKRDGAKWLAGMSYKDEPVECAAENIVELELALIRPNPYNPRKDFSGPEFDQLVASIKEKGLLQPVTVRPIHTGTAGPAHYELVFGERRWRASIEAATGTIRAIVRELSDEASFALMTIENLQRKDLSELEEARAFAGYVERMGEEAIPDLGKQTGIDARHIRRRVRVLKLPEKVLAAWEKGNLSFGHLEELCRLRDEKVILQYFPKCTEWNWSVRSLRDNIDREAPLIKKALFDAKACKACGQNSIIQKEQFDVDSPGKGAHCLDAGCFKRQQNDWLMGHWAETPTAKKYGTTGFRFEGSVQGYNTYEHFNGATPKKCTGCEKFVSFIRIDGSCDGDWQGRMCLDPACFRKARSKETKRDPKSGNSVMRSTYHGKEFREKFYQERLPVILDNHSLDEKCSMMGVIAALLEADSALSDWFRERFDKEHAAGERSYGTYQAWQRMSAMMPDDIEAALKGLIAYTLTDHGGSGFRDEIAVFYGIDLASEWRITRAYLEAKTIGEILEIGREVGVFDDRKALEYLKDILGKKRFEACGKKDLISCIIESGADLAGKVPKEILEIPARNDKDERGVMGHCTYCGSAFTDDIDCPNAQCPGLDEKAPPPELFCCDCGTRLNEDGGLCPQCDDGGEADNDEAGDKAAGQGA